MKLLTTEDRREVYMKVSARMVPKAVAPNIDKSLIVNLLEKNGFAEYQTDNQAIDELVVALNETASQIDSEDDAESVVFETQSIAYAEDAEVKIKVSEDTFDIQHHLIE